MIRIITALLIAAVGTVALAQEVTREAVASAEVSRFLDDWTKNISAEKRARRYQHKKSVVYWSLYYDLDPLLVARYVASESSWRSNVRGKLGEWGLMQIKNEKYLQKYPELKTDPDTNVKAGCELLRECIDTCPTLKSALGKYGTGYCTENGSWLDERWRQYQKAVEKFRKEREE